MWRGRRGAHVAAAGPFTATAIACTNRAPQIVSQAERAPSRMELFRAAPDWAANVGPNGVRRENFEKNLA
jgi:hypothetical protein